MISVIIPAHNEEALIESCLRRLTEGARDGELEVLVACNGCLDETEALARSFGPPVRVLSTNVASKTRALNLGDDEARGFPRFYVDADVSLDLAAVRTVAALLVDGRAFAAAPRARIDSQHASWAVRSFYRVWMALPYFDESMVGSGVYALSEEGRRRFDRFPEIIADDEFIRRQFAPDERRRVDDCTFAIRPPSRIRGVIREKTRSRLGLYQLTSRFPSLVHPQRAPERLRRVAAVLLGRPSIWPSLPVFACVAAIARFRARRRAARGDFSGWERDASSRPPAGIRVAAGLPLTPIDPRTDGDFSARG